MTYHVIYADPPWWYADRDKSQRFGGGARAHYPCMPDSDLIAMRPQLDAWAAEDCALCLWATGARLDFAVRLVDVWGFRYVTMLFVWVKTYTSGRVSTCTGTYTSQSCEYVLLGARGSIQPAVRLTEQTFMGPRGEHSEKPPEFRRRIEAMWPKARRLEMFARCRVPGWDAWGLEVDARLETAPTAAGQLRLQLERGTP